jgi:hypothetical protein
MLRLAILSWCSEGIDAKDRFAMLGACVEDY